MKTVTQEGKSTTTTTATPTTTARQQLKESRVQTLVIVEVRGNKTTQGC